MARAEDLAQVEREIEISIDVAMGAVNKKNKVLQLVKSADFQEIIEEGYFRDEAARLVSLMCDPEFQTPERQEGLRNDMIGISSFRFYLMNTMRMGTQMERQIASSEEELEELRNQVEGE